MLVCHGLCSVIPSGALINHQVMSAQSRLFSGQQAGRPSVLEGESSGPAYGAANSEGRNRVLPALPNGVTARVVTAESNVEQGSTENQVPEPTGPVVMRTDEASGLRGTVQDSNPQPLQQPQHSTAPQQQANNERQQQQPAAASNPAQPPAPQAGIPAGELPRSPRRQDHVADGVQRRAPRVTCETRTSTRGTCRGACLC